MTRRQPTDSDILSFRTSLRACQKCEIHANGPIPWSGDVNPTYAILGESPSRTDSKRGEPFSGDSGAILKHWLKQAGIDPSKVAYLNSVSCGTLNRMPTNSEISACRPWVHGQLEAIRPSILITLGVVAFKTVRHPYIWPELKMLHGKPMFYPRLNIPLFCTYDPRSYLKGRNKSYEEKIVAALTTAANFDGDYPEVCAVCGGEFYRFDPDGWGFPVCQRHAQRMQSLFPEDVNV